MKGDRKEADNSEKTNSAAQAAPPVPAPAQPLPASPAEVARIQRSARRVAARKERIQGKVAESTATTLVMGANHDDQRGWNQRLLDATGTTSISFAMDLLANTVLVEARAGEINDRVLNKTLAVFDGVEPRDEIEAMLVSQIVATQEASLNMLRRAVHTDRIDFMSQYGSLATKLQRTFVAQVEALAKLRRGGEQVVKVVHIHQGAQAIIGDVTHAVGPEGSIGQIGIQAHATTISELPALLGQDSPRDAVSVGRDAKRPLSNARRQEHGCAKGKSKRSQTRSIQREGHR